MGAILLGAALACVWAPWRSPRTPRLPARSLLAAAGVAALAALGWCLVSLHQFSDVLYTGGFLGVAAVTAVLVAVLVHPGTPGAGTVLGSRPLVWLGKRSYGIYLFYWPVLMLTRAHYDVPLSGNALLALRAALTVTLAALSYRFVEAPVRAGALGRLWQEVRHPSRLPWRPRLRVAGQTVGLVVALGAVAATAFVVRPSPAPATFLALEAADAAPPAALDTLVTSTTLPPATTTTSTTVDPLTTTPTIAAPVTSTTLPRVRVTGLGDSVLLEAKAVLERRLPDVAIDAEVGRQFRDLLGVARSQRDTGQLGQEVILQLGNNGPVTSAQFDEIMDVLRGVTRVVVINVKVPRPWEGPNNAMLAQGVTRWPNAVLLDWHKHGSAHPQLFADDGTHMGPTGVSIFVELILASL